MPVRIFISYACADNVPDPYPKGGPGWVDLLRERLMQRLPSYAGGVEEVEVNMDSAAGRIDLHTRLDDQFRRHVEAADFFLAVGSVCYFDRKWCREEYECFSGLKGKEDKYMMKLQLMGNCHGLPKDWDDTRVIRFFGENGEPFAQSVKAWVESPAYEKAMTELINKLGSAVQALARKRRKITEPAAQVYLAAAEGALEDEIDKVRSGLQEHGIALADSSEWEPAEFDQRLHAVLARPNMVYVQLLSPKPSQRMAQRVREQYEAALKVPNLARMLWRDPLKELDSPADENHKRMWETAVKDRAIQGFVADVAERVRAGRSGNAPVNDVPFVLLHYHENDAGLADKARVDIDATTCAKVLPPPPQGTLNPLSALLSKVRPCDGLMLLDGANPPEWLRTQLLLCLRELLSRDQALPAWGLLLLPPSDKVSPQVPPILQQDIRFAPINCRTGYNAQKLAYFTAFLQPPAPTEP